MRFFISVYFPNGNRLKNETTWKFTSSVHILSSSTPGAG